MAIPQPSVISPLTTLDDGRARAASLPVLAIGVVVVAALGALALSLFRGEETTATDFDTAVTSVGGTALPQLPDEGADPAVGQVAPDLKGEDLVGDTVVAPTTGKPTVLVFVAHWCPHCRRDVPVVQEWIDAGKKPADVDLIGIATAMNASRPNYPPSEWLTKQRWSSPIIADAGNQAADAFGLSAYPFWVAIGADGRVLHRATGELTPAQMTTLFTTAKSG